MNCRKFLKFPAVTGALLVAGEGTKTGVMAQGTTMVTEVDKATVWVLTDNYYDALRPDSNIAKRYRAVPGKSIHAEHGPAYYVETTVNGKASACMFDYGPDPVGVMNNIALLGLDPGKVNAFGLSHGHFDHWMGAVSILKQKSVTDRWRNSFLRGRGGLCPQILPPSRTRRTR